MGFIDTIYNINRMANRALDCAIGFPAELSAEESESMVNDLRGHRVNGRMHIYVRDESTEYELVKGTWTAIAPF